jgi:hypothetical protein
MQAPPGGVQMPQLALQQTVPLAQTVSPQRGPAAPHSPSCAIVTAAQRAMHALP